jgi:hypothetical protein
MLRFRELFVGVVFASALFLAWTWSRLAAAQACSWQGTSPFCSGSCGAGESEQTREGSDPGFIDNSTGGAIPFGASCLTGTKALCCKTPRSTCRWAGTAPFCDGQCSGSETKQTPPEGSSSGNSCWTGSKVYCCTSQPSSSGQPLVTEAYYRLQVKQGGKYLDLTRMVPASCGGWCNGELTGCTSCPPYTRRPRAALQDALSKNRRLHHRIGS